MVGYLCGHGGDDRGDHDGPDDRDDRDDRDDHGCGPHDRRRRENHADSHPKVRWVMKYSWDLLDLT